MNERFFVLLICECCVRRSCGLQSELTNKCPEHPKLGTVRDKPCNLMKDRQGNVILDESGKAILQGAAADQTLLALVLSILAPCRLLWYVWQVHVK